MANTHAFLLALLFTAAAFGAHATHLCPPSHPGLCIPFSTHQSSPVLLPRTLSSLLNETDALPLPLAARLTIISAARRILAQLNPHRFLHLNYLNVDPVAQLDALALRIQFANLSNVAFHTAMKSIFQTMDDRHTVYIPPAPLNVSFATLAFFAKPFYSPTDTATRRYVVTDIPAGLEFPNANFSEGVELLSWDGAPVDEVVLKLGRDGYGSNAAAQLSNGLVALTLRVLGSDPIPQAPAVTVTFRDVAGNEGVVTLPWLFFEVMDAGMAQAMMRNVAPMFGTGGVLAENSGRDDAEGDSGAIWRSEDSPILGFDSARVSAGNRTQIVVAEKFRALFSAEIVPTKAGLIGRFRVPSFNSTVNDELVSEISRVLGLMPPAGLVMDLRGNRGGQPDYVKALTELISGKDIPPQPLSLRSTSLLLQFLRFNSSTIPAEERRRLASFRAALRTSVRVGEQLSGPVASLYTSAVATRQTQVYTGPVVSVVDGLTYSSGDIYTGLHVDEKISLVVGTSDNVGAGGATVGTYSGFSMLNPRVFQPLPGGVDFTTALARIYRTGPRAGAIIENFGVRPNVRYYPTLNDAVNEDCDLLEFLGQTLVSMSNLGNSSREASEAAIGTSEYE